MGGVPSNQGGTNFGGGTPVGSGGTSASVASSSTRGGASANGGTATAGVTGTDMGSGGTGGIATSNPCADQAVLCGTGAKARCVDTNSDPQNCAQCNRDCGAGAGCVGGACIPPRCNLNFTLGNLPSTQTDGSPVALATGDINGDGHLDIVTANSSANTASVLFGDGNGLFRHRTDLATGDTPDAIAAGDLNHDDMLDLATANYDGNSVSLLLGKGDGTFEAKLDYSVGLGPVAIVVADFDVDDVPDVATANGVAGSVTVLLGNGNGAFKSKLDYPISALPTALATGDLNGDGSLDLATANGGGNSVTVLLGSTDGTFNVLPNVPAAISFVYPTSVSLGDLDNDANLDLFVSNPSSRTFSGSMGVMYGAGDGTFSHNEVYGREDCNVVAAADLDGDDQVDLVASTDFALGVFLGSSDGTLAPEVTYSTPGTPRQVAFGDFNGDHWLDIATCDVTGVFVLMAKGQGQFDAPPQSQIGSSVQALALGDLDRDGLLDLAATTEAADSVTVLYGQGDGTLVAPQDYGASHAGEHLELGDLDGDGYPEIVTARNAEYGVGVLWNVGEREFPYQWTPATASTTSILALGDVNSDAINDILVAKGSPAPGATVSLLLSNRVGSFVLTSFDDTDDRIKVGLADVNHDGKLDLIGTNARKECLTVQFGLGDGTFASEVVSPTGSSRISSRSIALGDLNGDGELDFVSGEDDTARLSVMLGAKDGAFHTATQYTAQSVYQTQQVELADLNGDGVLDLVWGYSAFWDGSRLVVMLGAGDGTFSCATATFAGTANQSSFAIGDLNGDKRTDLVVPDYPKLVKTLLNRPL